MLPLNVNGNKNDAYSEPERDFKFLVDIVRKEDLEKLTVMGHVEDNTGRIKHKVSYPRKLCKYMAEKEL